jgi:hypothetical protein
MLCAATCPLQQQYPELSTQENTMKILTTILISLSLVCVPLTAAADKGGSKGPSDRAYERANDNASFKRGDDYDKHYKGKKDKKGDHDHAEDNDDGRYRHRDDRDHDRDSDRDYSGSRDPNRDGDYRDRDRVRTRDRDQD